MLENVEPKRNGWLQIVEQYLRSLWDDERARREYQLSNSHSRFLSEFGMDTVQRGYVTAAQAHLEALSPPDTSCCHVTVEAKNRVLVEVEGGPDRYNAHHVPFMTTLLLLEVHDGSWRVKNVFEPCIGCNLTGNGVTGQCFYCSGTGKQIGVRVRRFLWFKRRSHDAERCEYCSGNGKCHECVGEDSPGWKRADCFRSPK